MQRRLFGAGLALFGFAACVGVAADDLWAQAMAWAAPEASAVAMAMNMESWEENTRGEVTKTLIAEYAWNEEVQDFLLISALENGRDVTDRERRRAQRREDDGEERQYPHEIFNPIKAEKLSLTPLDEIVEIDGHACRPYDFILQDEWPMGPGRPRPVIEAGTAYLDMGTGLPRRVISSLAQGPDMVTDYSYRLDADADEQGRMRTRHLEIFFAGRMVVAMAGGFRMEFLYPD